MKIYEEINDISCNLLKKLNSKGIFTLKDLLYFFPKDYEDLRQITKISNIIPGCKLLIFGEIKSCSFVGSRNKKSFFRAVVSDDTGSVECLWFNMPYVAKIVKVGIKSYFYGKFKKNLNSKFVIINPSCKKQEQHKKIIPIYDINSFKKSFGNLLKNTISNNYFGDVLPQEVTQKYKILSRNEAIKNIHIPLCPKDIMNAKRYFAIEEIFVNQLGFVYRKYQHNISKYQKINYIESSIVKNFIRDLSFKLTKSQKQAITSIYQHLEKNEVINILLQGDVGCGKTIVAMIIMIYLIENGYQTAFMIPTEILCYQHYNNFVNLLSKHKIKCKILTSSTSIKEKNEIIQQLKNGEISMLISTHSVIYDMIQFKNLGLIVIDEQHKFGVNQRERLISKSTIPNIIVMSATPIPRSLALTLYGDLDIITITEKPINRKNIITIIEPKKSFKNVCEKVKIELDNGFSAYFVVPIIDKTDYFEIESIFDIYEKLKNIFTQYEIFILHGKMNTEERSNIIKKFSTTPKSILITTTIVEVGIDIPIANVMVILYGERFGLSQLHQIRGRIGRSDQEGKCFILYFSENDTIINRLKILEQYHDGFTIAEEDLKIRSCGEMFGIKQSGTSDLKFADLVRDIKTIKIARIEAEKYFETNQCEIKNEILKHEINKKFSNFKH